MNPVIYIDEENALEIEFLYKEEVNDIEANISTNMLMAICIGIDSVLTTLEGDFNSKLEKISEVFTNSSLTGLLANMKVQTVKFSIKNREEFDEMFKKMAENNDNDENVDSEVIQ